MLINQQAFAEDRIVKYIEPAMQLVTSDQLIFVQLACPLSGAGDVEPIATALSARKDWLTMLDCSARKELSIIGSNIGNKDLVLTNENILDNVPFSVPGQLLRLLYNRFVAFGGMADSGLALVFFNLHAGKDDRLLSLILETAHLNQMEFQFMDWLETAIRFYFNSFDRSNINS